MCVCANVVIDVEICKCANEYPMCGYAEVQMSIRCADMQICRGADERMCEFLSEPELKNL